MNCTACDKQLKPVFVHLREETTYQFSNALWIGFHGSDGMFVDNLEATMPINTDERWLRKSDERDEYGLYCDFYTVMGDDGREHLVDDPDWKMKFKEERTLPGYPDYEAVLCHECAHEMCVLHPWLERLINSHNSHSHPSAYHKQFPQHGGWDYDYRAEKERE